MARIALRIVWVIVLVNAASLLADAPGATTCPAELKGCWRCKSTTQPSYLRFEDGRLSKLDGYVGLILPATYSPTGVSFRLIAARYTNPWRIADGVLTFGPATQVREYTRIEGVPAELTFEPLKLPEANAVPADKLKAVQAELAKRYTTDQDVRKGRIARAKMKQIDTENTAYLRTIAAELGWIDAQRFGSQAAHAAFLLLQHSGDLSLMRAAVPLIEADVKAGRLDGASYAMLYDRLQLMTAGKQRYGTQIAMNADREVVVPSIEDKNRVNEYRRSVSLQPLEQYVRMWGAAKPVFED